MSLISYFKRRLYYGIETTYGQAASMEKALLAQSWDLGAEYVEEDIYAGSRTYSDRLVLGLNFSPSMEIIPLTGEFMKLIFGKVTNSGTAPPYTHTLEPDPNTLPSFTVEAARLGATNMAERAVGCLVESAEFSFENDGFFSVSLDCRAKSASLVTGYTDPNISLPNKSPFLASSRTVTIGTTTYGEVISGSITFENELVELPREGDYVVGFAVGKASISGELEIAFKDSSLMADFLSKNRKDVVIKLSRATNDYIQFTLGNCYVEWSGELPFEDSELTQTVTLYPKTITVEVKDDIAAY
ncbi:MAG: phage tail tube protein [Nitrososphaerota archaeon]